MEGKKGYEDLSEEEKIKVQQVLYITDKFCIGEAAYHDYDRWWKRITSLLLSQAVQEEPE